jgi:predicted secreted protein
MLRTAMAMESADVAPPALEAGTSEIVIGVNGSIELK